MKLTSLQRIIVHSTFFALLLSGLVWLLFNFYLDHNTPLRFLNAWSLRLHGLAAFGFLIVFGMLFSTHISFNWHVKKNRRPSGLILTALFTVLILSGYFLYYLGDEDLRIFNSYFHWLSGLICTIVFAIHFLKKSNIKKKISKN